MRLAGSSVFTILSPLVVTSVDGVDARGHAHEISENAAISPPSTVSVKTVHPPRGRPAALRADDRSDVAQARAGNCDREQAAHDEKREKRPPLHRSTSVVGGGSAHT